MQEKASNMMPPRLSSLRWGFLRRLLLVRKHNENTAETGVESISRKPTSSFNMIPFCLQAGHHIENSDDMADGCSSIDTCVCYMLPGETPTDIFLFQRMENHINLKDFEISNRHNIDNTGLVCSWPSEDVLAHFCLSNVEMFKSKKVLELGSGYGLAGFAIAAGTSASEVVISDGNPQVVDYIKHNISANAGKFGDTDVKSMLIHWDRRPDSRLLNYFDIIVASDCTFFKEFHEGLALVVKSLLRPSRTSEAIFFNPRRGDSLGMFLQKLEMIGLQYDLIKNYDNDVWSRHLTLINGSSTWPNYNEDHCYPLLLRISLKDSNSV